MRAYVLAPLAAVATLVLPMVVTSVLAASGVLEAIGIAWIFSLPIIVFGLPLAFAGELLLVLAARAFGHDPRTIEPTSILLATGILGLAVGGGFWLASDSDLAWWIALLPTVASLIGGATFLGLRQPVARDASPVVPFDE